MTTNVIQIFQTLSVTNKRRLQENDSLKWLIHLRICPQKDKLQVSDKITEMSLKGITWVWNTFDSKIKYKSIEGTLWFNFFKNIFAKDLNKVKLISKMYKARTKGLMPFERSYLSAFQHLEYHNAFTIPALGGISIAKFVSESCLWHHVFLKGSRELGPSNRSRVVYRMVSRTEKLYMIQHKDFRKITKKRDFSRNIKICKCTDPL